MTTKLIELGKMPDTLTKGAILWDVHPERHMRAERFRVVRVNKKTITLERLTENDKSTYGKIPIGGNVRVPKGYKYHTSGWCMEKWVPDLNSVIRKITQL